MSDTTFQQGTTESSGAFSGDYLWSNANNWTAGVPGSGDTATLGFTGVDDIADLTLAEVVMTARETLLAAGTLTIGTLDIAGAGGSTIAAETASGYASADLVINGMVNSGVFLNAIGAGATLDYAATVDGGNYFRPYSGGMEVFDTAVVAERGQSHLQYQSTAGTFAFKALPVASSGTVTIDVAQFTGVTAGDVLELPVGTVQSVSYGSSTIGVEAGGTLIEVVNVNYGAGSLTGFAQAADAATGLQAITFTDAPATTFQQGRSVTGFYPWALGGNWTAGIPAAGASVNLSAGNVDNISTLSLTAATLASGDVTDVGGTLTVGDLTVASGTTIAADTAHGSAPRLAIGGVSGSGATIAAIGGGASTDVNGASDPGETYLASGGGALILRTAPNAASVLAFAGSHSMLALTDPAGTVAAAVQSLGGSDTIELPGSAVLGVSFGASTLGITTDLGTTVFSDVSYGFTPSSFNASHDAATGLEAVTFCFLAGTRIATPGGEVAVETLRPGDMVTLADGGSARVRWLGRQSIAARFGDPLHTWPVRIRAGALGGGLPRRDLLLSPGHALFLDGLLVQAGALVNGRAIRRETRMPEQFAYYHVELDTHALLLAEGAAAESFLDGLEDRRFDNAHNRPPPAEEATELPWPRIKAARQVPPVLHLRLAAAATQQGAAAA